MGTRSLTIVTDGPQEVMVMYRQMDGYPSGHGMDLFEFLDGMVITHGISSLGPARTANGSGCLAAQIVAEFKQGAGGIYLLPGGTRCSGEEYIYVVDVATPVFGRTVLPMIEVWDVPESRRSKKTKGTMIFRGTAAEGLVWAKQYRA